MWPWEHLAFGYVLYSFGVHATWRRSPGGAEAIALAVATQTPDLIDKPLSWGLQVFPTGYALGHSLVFAGTASVAALWYARRRGRFAAGMAFVVGYGSHLAGDVLSPFLDGGSPAFDRLFWPFVAHPAYRTHRGFAGRLTYYLGRYVHEATTPEHLPYLYAYLAAFLCVGLLWVTDGAPGIRETVVVFRAAATDRANGP